MKSDFAGFGLLLLLLTSCGTPQAEWTDSTAAVNDWNRQRVVFYNVENLFHPDNDPNTNDDWFTPQSDINWDQEKYQHKLNQLADVISWTGDELPVLIGLAEVENQTCVHDLASTGKLAQGDYGVVHFDSPDERGIDVALMYRKGMFTVTHEAPIEVEIPNDRTRDILHVEGKIGSETVHVFVCHWSSRGEGVKETQHRRNTAAGLVRFEVDRILEDDGNASILIMGDMNDYPTSPSIEEYLQATCNDREGGDLIDLVCAEHKANRGSYNYRGNWGYIDHFIVSSGMLDEKGLVAGEAKALWDRRLLFDHPKYGRSPDKTYSGRRYHGGYSDHLPIVLELTR